MPIRIRPVLLLATLLLLATPTVAQPGPAGTWSQLLPPPTRRSAATVVHDTARDRLILFGGGRVSPNGDWSEFNGTGNDTWVLPLAGGTWTRLHPVGSPPPPRAAHSAVYDPMGDRMIVFGGVAGFGLGTELPSLGDVWELSLAGPPTWTELSPAGPGPAARFGHVAIHDPIHQTMVVTGGGNLGARTSDAWVLPLAGPLAWQEIAIGTGPQLLPGAAGVYEPTSRSLLLHGEDEVWSLDLSDPGPPSWTQVTPVNATPPRLGHVAVLDENADPWRLVIHGGVIHGMSPITLPDDTWALQNGTWSQLAPAGDPPLFPYRKAGLHDPSRQRMLVFGGYGGGLGNEVHTLDLAAETWAPVATQPIPPPHNRGEFALVLDPVRRRLLLFGGANYDDNSPEPLNDLWELPLDQVGDWQLVAVQGTPPPARRQPKVVYDATRDRLVLHGGLTIGGGGMTYYDVWELPLTGSPAWNELSPGGTPPSRGPGYRGVYDPVGDRILFYGGAPGSMSVLDVLEFSGGPAWSTLAVAGPVPASRFRSSHAVGPGNRIFLSGGNTGSVALQDLWELDLDTPATWRQLADCPEPAYALLHDPARQRLIQFVPGGLWSFPLNEETWYPLTPDGEPPREDFFFVGEGVFDPLRDRALVYGIHGDDTWELVFGAPTTAVPPTRPGAILHVSRNPFRGSAAISYRLEEPSQVTLTMHDVSGREVGRLVDRVQTAGTHSVTWEVTDTDPGAAAGIYFARLRVGDRVSGVKLLRLAR